MGIKFNNKDITAINYGSLEIAKLMYGSNLIWEKSSGEGTLIFHDDFNRSDGSMSYQTPVLLGKYTGVQGFRVVNKLGEAVYSSNRGGLKVHTGPSNFKVEAIMQQGSTIRRIGILMNAGPSQTSIENGSETITFDNVDLEHYRTGNPYTYARVRHEKNVRQWFTLTVTVIDKKISAYIDGDLILESQLREELTLNNTVGIYHYYNYSGPKIKDLKVWLLN